MANASDLFLGIWFLGFVPALGGGLLWGVRDHLRRWRVAERRPDYDADPPPYVWGPLVAVAAWGIAGGALCAGLYNVAVGMGSAKG